MLIFNPITKSFAAAIFFLFLTTLVCLPGPVQAIDAGLHQPAASRDAFTVSAEPVKKMAQGFDQGKYDLVVDSETISRSLQSEKGLINLKIEFASGSALITEKTEVQIAEIAKALQSQKLAGEKIVITGHTDNVGSAEGNFRLSRQRAQAVEKALLNSGIAKSRLSARGLGESAPLADNLSAAGRSRNRRVTLSRQ